MVKKSISLFLLLAALGTSLFNLPYPAEGRDLIPMDPAYWEGTGIIAKNTQQEKNGIKALLWIPKERGHYLKTKKVPTDWSQYNQIELSIYSPKATGSWINILIADQNNHLASSFLEVDWMGWNSIKLSYNQLFGSFSSQDINWKKINYLAFESHTSALLNIDETELSFRSIELNQAKYPDIKIKTLNLYQNSKSFLFPEEIFSLWKKVNDEKSNLFLSKSVEKIIEGKERFLKTTNPSLEDIRDAVFYGRLMTDPSLLTNAMKQLSMIKKQYWDTLAQQNELLIQNSLISYCISMDLLTKERKENPAIENTLQNTLLYVATLEKNIVEYWVNFYPFGMGNNHATRAACALGIASLLYRGPERKEWYQLSITTLAHFFDFQITTEGVLNEGTHYYLFLMEILTYFNHFLLSATQQNLFVDFPFSKKLTAMVDWSIQIRGPRGYLPAIDDSWQNMVNFPSRFLTPFLPNRSLLCWSSKVSDQSSVLGESWNIVKPFYIPLLLLSLSSYEPPEEPTSTLCHVFEDDSEVIFRDSWKKEANFLVVSGKKIRSLHEHDDTGNIQIEAFRTPILLESGYGPQGWTSLNRNYYVSGKAHNILLVNGEGPKSYYNGSLGPIDTSRVQEYYSFASFSFSKLAISFDVQNKNLLYNRSIAFVPQIGNFPHYTLIFDAAKSPESKTYQTLFHPNGSRLSSSPQKYRFRIDENNQTPVFVDILALEPCKSKINKGFYSQYWDNEKNTEYISFEQSSKEALFTTLVFPHLETSQYEVQSETNQKGISREYKLTFSNQDSYFSDFYNLNPYGEIRQMKNQGTNANLSFVRKSGKEELIQAFFIQNGSFLNHQQKSIFFSSSKMNYLYFSKNQQIYQYYCQYDARNSSSRSFFKVSDFEKLFLDNQPQEFERTKDGIFVNLPAGKHTLTFH